MRSSNEYGVPNVARAFGVHGKPLENVMMVAQKALSPAGHGTVSRAWRVLVVNEEGCLTHWFNTNRPFDDREMTDHAIGEKVNFMTQRKPTTADDWEDKVRCLGYKAMLWELQGNDQDASQTYLKAAEAAPADPHPEW